MWNGNAVAAGAFVLALSLVSIGGCDRDAASRQAATAAHRGEPFELPRGRYQVDPERNRVWVLTSAGAFVYDLYKSRGQLSMDHSILIAFGFAVSFVAAWIVVKTFLDYVQRHGFALFAWWRVIVGVLGLIGLALGK